MPTIEERLTLVEQKVMSLKGLWQTLEKNLLDFKARIAQEKAEATRKEAEQAQKDEIAKHRARRRK